MFQSETIKGFLKKGWMKIESEQEFKFILYKAIEYDLKRSGNKFEEVGIKCKFSTKMNEKLIQAEAPFSY